MDNLAIYCELKINDKNTGELKHVLTGVYYADLSDFAECIRKGTVDVFKDDIIKHMLEDCDVTFDSDISFGRLSLVCLENEFPDNYDEEDED